MNLALTWIGGLVRRRPARLVGVTIGVALAVTLFASLGAFFTTSKARMTVDASRGVPVDWQVQLNPGVDPAKAQQLVSGAPGVDALRAVGYADVTHFRNVTGGSVQLTGPGQALGIPPGYPSTFPGVIRYLVGSRTGVLLAQQTAANLHADVGSDIVIGRPDLPAVRARVDGIVDLPTADTLFQVVGLPPGAGPQAPPDNVVLLPAGTWHRWFDPVTSVKLSAARMQIHVALSSSLPSDPAAAFGQVLGAARNLEARLAGSGLVGDNLGAQLDAARADALYAELLFLFLGIPGVALAAILTAVVAASGRARRRREQALLRIRGASTATIVRVAAAEASVAGVAGTTLGLGGAALVGRLLFHGSGFGATPAQALSWTIGAAILGVALAFAAIVLPARRDARKRTIRQALASLDPVARPLWARLYVDVVLLVSAALVYWEAVRGGYQVVLAPEGVPRISVDSITLLAPLLLWIGSALLAWRLAFSTLGRGRRAVTAAVRPVAHELSGVVAASMSRQRHLLSRGLLIMALTGSFAVSTAVFNATYAAQARVDAQLTNGADVTASTTASSGLPARSVDAVRSLPGVVATQPMQHRFAYVANDLQDLYGIDPRRIGEATAMSDAFFAGGHAQQVLALLASRPDAVLVSDETVSDFQLHPGDLLRLRLQFAGDHAYHVVRFHYAGIVREFPTAPRDSFIVANASYVAQQTGSPAYQTLLIRTDGSPPAVADAVRRVLGPAAGTSVQDIETQLKITLSGLTALDLSGLTKLELSFAFLLATAASGLVLALGLAERRRTFAIASALGARTRQLASFVWSEAAFVTLGGLAMGIVGGWVLSYVIVKILTGVFDPPPEHLSVPWAYLGAVCMVTLVAVVAVCVGAVEGTRRPAMKLLRDL